MAEIKFNQLGFIIIPLYARHKDTPTMFSRRYKVDTGANCTTMGKDLLFNQKEQSIHAIDEVKQ